MNLLEKEDVGERRHQDFRGWQEAWQLTGSEAGGCEGGHTTHRNQGPRGKVRLRINRAPRSEVWADRAEGGGKAGDGLRTLIELWSWSPESLWL